MFLALGAGDVLAWVNEPWELGQVERHDFATEDLCKDIPTSLDLVFPERRYLKESHMLCSSLGGSLSVPRNEIQNLAMTELAYQYYNVCKAHHQNGKTTWLGVESFDETWITSDTLLPLTYSNFMVGEGLTDDNCAFLHSGPKSERVYGKWGSSVCTDSSPR